jgi:hypothetical protein
MKSRMQWQFYQQPERPAMAAKIDKNNVTVTVTAGVQALASPASAKHRNVFDDYNVL